MKDVKKSFLKWAGGKSKLLDEIFGRLPAGNRLIEPFMGSGVVFLNSEYSEYVGGDINRDLLSIFWLLGAEDSDGFIEETERLFVPENNTRERFVQLRSEFNTSSDSRRRASLFVWMNRHAFNGLCRYNASGNFNVPFGGYKNPVCPSEAMKVFAAEAKKKNSEFRLSGFDAVMDEAGKGDVVYCDPPYAPLSPTASFSSYATEGFGKKDQERLAAACVSASERGAYVLVSNHDTPWVRELYAAAKVDSLLVSRSVSCKGDNRKAAPELLALFSPRGDGNE